MTSTVLPEALVSIECHEAACDYAERAHVMPAGLEPAVHEIRLKYAGLSKSDGDREWRMWLTNLQDEYTEDEATSFLHDVNAVKRLMHDLNAAH